MKNKVCISMELDEAIKTLNTLHSDNVRDTVAGIRTDSEFIMLKKIHERNIIMTKILKALK